MIQVIPWYVLAVSPSVYIESIPDTLSEARKARRKRRPRMRRPRKRRPRKTRKKSLQRTKRKRKSQRRQAYHLRKVVSELPQPFATCQEGKSKRKTEETAEEKQEREQKETEEKAKKQKISKAKKATSCACLWSAFASCYCPTRPSTKLVTSARIPTRWKHNGKVCLVLGFASLKS